MKQSIAAAVALVLTANGAGAEAQVCEPDARQEALGYLRRLSLDLVGTLPAEAQLEAVAARGAVDPALIDELLASEEAVAELREYHRDLLWANVDDQRIVSNNFVLRGPTPAYWALSRAVRYRGAYESCLDEPARFGAGGAILTRPDPTRANVAKEGWVMVRPYWAPDTEVKVCAFDAQVALTADGVDCTRSPAKGCGCGPNLRWCQSAPDRTARAITGAMAEQMLRFVDGVVRSGRPYTEVITAKDIEVNGPLSHYFRYQTQTSAGAFYVTRDPGYTVPAMPFTARDTWTRVNRTGKHAGVLTTPAYLLKFQSDRGRANRFYNAFLCQYFQAPAGGLPASGDACHQEPNLTKRCGCRFCHVALEPAAAYWGRWSEAGIAPLDEAAFPKTLAACAAPGAESNPVCKRFYLIDPGHPDEARYEGTFLPYVFADRTREANIAAGPDGIARAAIQSGAFASCTVKRMWARYMGREANDGDAEVIDALRRDFVASRYELRSLIKALVTRPEYVKAGNFTGVKE